MKNDNIELVSHAHGTILKALGFDEPCYSIHDYGYMIPRITTMAKPRFINSKMNVGHVSKTCTAPTYSQAFRWLRKKGIICSVEIDYYYDSKGVFKITENKYKYAIVSDNKLHDMVDFRTYEDAETQCLSQAIEILMSKK